MEDEDKINALAKSLQESGVASSEEEAFEKAQGMLGEKEDKQDFHSLFKEEIATNSNRHSVSLSNGCHRKPGDYRNKFRDQML